MGISRCSDEAFSKIFDSLLFSKNMVKSEGIL